MKLERLNPLKGLQSQSLLSKLGRVLIAVLGLLGVAQYFLGHWLVETYRDESNQHLYMMVASQLATRIEPLTRDTIDYTQLDAVLSEAIRINPQIDIYIVSHDGKILAYSRQGAYPSLTTISLDPILRFVRDPALTYPFYGDNPREPLRPRVFSAAPIRFGAMPAYLYVLIGNATQNATDLGLLTKHITIGSIAMLVLSLSVAGAMAFFAFSWITRRLTRMTASVERFEKGELGERFQDRSQNDEIGRLGRAFNHMASTIEANMVALREKDNLRRQLIANVSHDLRGPITTISGFLETLMLKGEDLSVEARERYIRIALSSVDGLNRMIQELFELSKLEAREVVPKLVPVDASDLFAMLEEKFIPLAAQRHVELRVSHPQSPVGILADRAMLERALSNLLENAIRYTPGGGQVTFGGEERNGRLAIFVADTGVGIDDDDLPHIFDQFFRAKRTQRKDMPGTGLGLAIVKKILEAHGSDVHVESEPDKGTRFGFELPLAQAEAPEPPPVTIH